MRSATRRAVTPELIPEVAEEEVRIITATTTEEMGVPV